MTYKSKKIKTLKNTKIFEEKQHKTTIKIFAIKVFIIKITLEKENYQDK